MEDVLPRQTLLPALPVPWRYVAFVAVSFVALLLMGSTSQWVPWTEAQSSLTDSGWAGLAASASFWVWAAAPAVTLWRPSIGGLLAGLPFVITLGDRTATWPLVLFASLLACAAAATWRTRRGAVVLAVAAMVPVLTYAFGRTTMVTGYGFEVERGGASAGNLAFQVFAYAVVAAAAVGLGVWMRASYLAPREAASLAARTAEVEQKSTVVGERARLARDLHDVVAHHVSLIAVRAETAPYTVPDLSPGATALLADIAEDSRRALDELRGVLGILGRSTGEVELAPQPGASDIEMLVESARRGGDVVELTASDVEGVGSAPGYVAYRVVQEALTNARRHAAGAPVRVEVEGLGRGVLVRVSNETSASAVAPGNGLAGMRERVEGLGGTFEAGIVDGMLCIKAVLPA